ncbi:MAG: hypothetical protein JOZ24_13210, partial [Candidatus Eremiobacteraeota bacterium]|nr:hypothetical protein [Candidatus Eremiobacteraeota bacterium]
MRSRTLTPVVTFAGGAALAFALGTAVAALSQSNATIEGLQAQVSAQQSALTALQAQVEQLGKAGAAVRVRRPAQRSAPRPSAFIFAAPSGPRVNLTSTLSAAANRHAAFVQQKALGALKVVPALLATPNPIPGILSTQQQLQTAIATLNQTVSNLYQAELTLNANQTALQNEWAQVVVSVSNTRLELQSDEDTYNGALGTLQNRLNSDEATAAQNASGWMTWNSQYQYNMADLGMAGSALCLNGMIDQSYWWSY